MFANDPLHREGMLRPTRNAMQSQLRMHLSAQRGAKTRRGRHCQSPAMKKGRSVSARKSILSSAYAKIDNDVI